MRRAVGAASLRLLALAVLLSIAPSALHGQAEDEPVSEPSEPEAQEPPDEPITAPAPAPVQAPSPPAAELAPELAQRVLSFRAGVGFGVGTLAFQRPIAAGTQVLPETPFATAELFLRARAWPRNRFSIETLLAYRSSLGLVLRSAPLFALPQDVALRVQRVELSVGPVVRLADAAGAPALAFPAGLVFRSLFPAVHQFSVPKYTLGGVQLRAELMLRLGELISVRVGPEAQWLALISGSLRSEGACCQGLAIGGQGSIEASVGPTLRLALAYGESHAFVPIGTWAFMDVERFLTTRIAGEL